MDQCENGLNVIVNTHRPNQYSIRIIRVVGRKYIVTELADIRYMLSSLWYQDFTKDGCVRWLCSLVVAIPAGLVSIIVAPSVCYSSIQSTSILMFPFDLQGTQHCFSCSSYRLRSPHCDVGLRISCRILAEPSAELHDELAESQLAGGNPLSRPEQSSEGGSDRSDDPTQLKPKGRGR